jgi:hypothetical protein
MSVIRTRNEGGFALFIVAALFIAFALIASSMIDRTNATQQLTLQKNTQEKLTKLSYALIQYALDHSDRYPCPADPQVAATDVTFGASVTGCEVNPLQGGIVELDGMVTIRGMVPVKELLPYGVDLNDAFDSWDNRIMLNINRNLTPAGGGLRPSGNLPVAFDGINFGLYHIRQDFILVSYGRDGIGGTPRSLTSIPIVCVLGTLRNANCDSNLLFYTFPMWMGPNVKADEYFDDIMSFYGLKLPD